jgi:hypothetical protein
MTVGSLSVALATLAAGGSARPRLSGVFLSAYEQDVTFSQERWAQEFDAMAAVGISTVIVGESASNTWPNYSLAVAPDAPSAPQTVKVYAFWPTKIGTSVTGYEMVDTGHAYIERVLKAADARNMSVILGNADVPWVDQGGAQSWKQQAVLSRAILAELWSLYGAKHASLAGFYNVVELSCDVRNEALSLQIAHDMFGPFAAQVKAFRPSLRAVTSPYYRPSNASDPNNHQMSADAWASFWRRLLSAAPDFDTIAPQDGMGAGGNNLTTVRSYLSALSKVTRDLGRTLWSNVELFTASKHCAVVHASYCPASCEDRRPAPFERVISQMAAEAPIADDRFLIAYEWHAYLSPHSTACDGKSLASSPDWHTEPAAQYARYQEYVHGGAPPPPAPPGAPGREY